MHLAKFFASADLDQHPSVIAKQNAAPLRERRKCSCGCKRLGAASIHQVS